MDYKTKTMEQTAFTANLSKLPLMKNLDSSQIVTNVDSFRKGAINEKSLFWFIKLAVFGAVAYGVWQYVLPVVMVALGQLIALSVTAVFLVFMVLMAPVILKALRLFTRNMHKALIKYDPFAQLEIERQKMLQNQAIFRIAQQSIIGLRQDMELEASKAEKEAQDGQTRMLTLQAKAGKIKATMDEMQVRMGVAAKGEDEYVQHASDLQKVLAEFQRVTNQINQNKDFTEKFGSRGLVMKKLSQKLTLVETAMDIKIQDFDATVLMLQKDYNFAQKANAATSAAKSVLGFSNGWEMDVALDSVVATIAADTAMTAGNLKDIESITSKYSLDSDELYANLNVVADRIKIGEDIVPSAKQYRNPEYILTSNDKLKSGGFGDLF